MREQSGRRGPYHQASPRRPATAPALGFRRRRWRYMGMPSSHRFCVPAPAVLPTRAATSASGAVPNRPSPRRSSRGSRGRGWPPRRPCPSP
jgi:hypothetical protein